MHMHKEKTEMFPESNTKRSLMSHYSNNSVNNSIVFTHWKQSGLQMQQLSAYLFLCCSALSPHYHRFIYFGPTYIFGLS